MTSQRPVDTPYTFQTGISWVLRIFLGAIRSKVASALDQILSGLKNNVGFVIQNDRNLQRRKEKLYSRWYDDCKGHMNLFRAQRRFCYISNEGALGVCFSTAGSSARKRQLLANVFTFPLSHSQMMWMSLFLTQLFLSQAWFTLQAPSDMDREGPKLSHQSGIS